MKVPDKFPAGCAFSTSFGGDEYVFIPGDGWFILDESTVELRKLGSAPVSNGAPTSEAFFLDSVAAARERIAASAAA